MSPLSPTILPMYDPLPCPTAFRTCADEMDDDTRRRWAFVQQCPGGAKRRREPGQRGHRVALLRRVRGGVAVALPDGDIMPGAGRPAPIFGGIGPHVVGPGRSQIGRAHV